MSDYELLKFTLKCNCGREHGGLIFTDTNGPDFIHCECGIVWRVSNERQDQFGEGERRG